MRVELVIPFAGDCPYRLRALEWIRSRYAEHFPAWELTIGEGGDPWVKADAVMPAIRASEADVIVVADADVWCEGLSRAVEKLGAGVGWVVPYGPVHRLDEGSTLRYMAGEREDLTFDRPSYPGTRGGGIVVAARETLLAVPIDPHFIGWGQEDQSWGLALECLAGRPWRGGSSLIHLWHPPQEHDHPKYGSPASRRRHRRYIAARRKPDLMRALLTEERP